MIKKFGINSTRAEKKGPVVKNGLNEKIEREITCACGKKFMKSCPNELYCEISAFHCPHCGAELK